MCRKLYISCILQDTVSIAKRMVYGCVLHNASWILVELLNLGNSYVVFTESLYQFYPTGHGFYGEVFAIWVSCMMLISYKLNCCILIRSTNEAYP